LGLGHHRRRTAFAPQKLEIKNPFIVLAMFLCDIEQLPFEETGSSPVFRNIVLGPVRQDRAFADRLPDVLNDLAALSLAVYFRLGWFDDLDVCRRHSALPVVFEILDRRDGILSHSTERPPRHEVRGTRNS
jgi:hypothetical protein